MNKFNLLPFIVALISAIFSISSYATNDELSIKVYNADSHSFHVNSTLIYGEREAVVIDAGFTKADAYRIAANVLDTGKTLTTIFVSQADPDYYFGVETLKKIFPDARVLATPSVKAKIEQTVAGKVAFWGPKMGLNAPKAPIIPDAYTQQQFTVDGKAIEIKGSKSILAHRPYLWIPTERAVIGNIAIFGNLHVWTADIQTEELWQAWLTQLDEILALSPSIVVPGHMKQGQALDSSTIEFTKRYLTDFSLLKSQSKTSKDLIQQLNEKYPNAQLPIALNIGAKVHMGEMKW